MIWPRDNPTPRRDGLIVLSSHPVVGAALYQEFLMLQVESSLPLPRKPNTDKINTVLTKRLQNEEDA